MALTPPGDPLPWNRYVAFGLLVVVGVASDLISKEMTFRALGCPGRSEWEWQIPDVVRFVIQTNLNFGALWGIGQGFAWLFATLSVVAIAGVLTFLFWMKQARSWWLTIALGLVLSGALGNLYDRLGLHGMVNQDGTPAYAVRDFLYFRFFETFDWAIFNLADTYLVTGAIMLAIYSFKAEPANDPAASSSIAAANGAAGPA